MGSRDSRPPVSVKDRDSRPPVSVKDRVSSSPPMHLRTSIMDDQHRNDHLTVISMSYWVDRRRWLSSIRPRDTGPGQGGVLGLV